MKSESKMDGACIPEFSTFDAENQVEVTVRRLRGWIRLPNNLLAEAIRKFPEEVTIPSSRRCTSCDSDCCEHVVRTDVPANVYFTSTYMVMGMENKVCVILKKTFRMELIERTLRDCNDEGSAPVIPASSLPESSDPDYISGAEAGPNSQNLTELLKEYQEQKQPVRTKVT